jgi:hypothetical protein
MLYGISAVFIQMPFSGDAVLDALDLDALDVGIRPPARTPDTPSSTR